MGYVGNSAAVFTLQRMGHEVWPVPTLLFSNHPGHGDVGGQVLRPELLSDLVAGLVRRGVFENCQALLSGYLGQASNGPIVLETLDLAKNANRSVVFVLDPVIGDEETGVFVADDVVKLMRDSLLAKANIVTPNVFELKVLTGTLGGAEIDLIKAADRLRSKGPDTMVITGVGDRPERIGTLLVSNAGVWRVDTPVLDLGRRANGAGDFFNACFLGYLLNSDDLVMSLEHAVSSVFAALSYTVRNGLDELDLVHCQNDWMKPAEFFTASELFR